MATGVGICFFSFKSAGVLHVSLQNSRLVKVNSTFVRGDVEQADVDVNGKAMSIQNPLSIGILF